MTAHLDTVLGRAGTVTIGAEAVTRESLALRCAQYSPWVVACLTVSATRDEIATCDPGSEPTSGTYAGPSADEKDAFYTCATAATTRAALDDCHY